MPAKSKVVDLTKVSEGGNFRPRRKPEGDYRAKIMKVDDHTSNKGIEGWVYTIMVEGDGRSTYPYYLAPEEKQLWKIAKICSAAGLNVTGKRVNFNPNKLVGKDIGIALEDDEYEGKFKSTIADVFPIGEVGGNASDPEPEGDETYEDDDIDTEIEDDEPEPTPPPRKRAAARKRAPEPEPEEDDEELEEEEPPPPPRKRVAKRQPAPEPEPEDEELDDEDEEEPAPPPRRRTTPPAKKAAPRKRAAPPVEEDDDLDDLEVDDL